MMVTEDYVWIKTQLCVKSWSGANNPRAKMSLGSIVPLVKKIMFLSVLLKIKRIYLTIC